MSDYILSVGIDVGTTTSQIIFSRLTIENKAGISRVPQINITNKEILFRSEIHFTPLLSTSYIDGSKLADIVKKEYKQANIDPKDITVGAVIITGESSRKENSQEIVHALGEIAGDFVVASAGPDLEGIIAGRGSGAAHLSKEKHCIIANIDIGGGTSNIAIFDDGVPIDTACLDIGGRQIKLDSITKKVIYIAPKTQKLCTYLGIKIGVGENISPSDIEELCKAYTSILAQALGIIPKTDLVSMMLTDHELTSIHDLSYVIISGGVAESVYDDLSLTDPFIYNDIGLIFGDIIKRYFPKTVPLLKGTETIRATVIGAGAFTASLSGSTIHVEKEVLPLKNLPVIKFSKNEEKLSGIELIEIIQQKIEWNWLEGLKGVVLGFELDSNCDYNQLKEFSNILTKSTKKLQQHNQLLIVVIENDLAKALGQILSQEYNFPFLVLDSIRLQDGDFMDIGIPLENHKVVPVVVKSLIFNK